VKPVNVIERSKVIMKRCFKALRTSATKSKQNLKFSTLR